METKIYFKMVDHDLDDCGYYQSMEETIVVAESKEAAVQKFVSDMVGLSYTIHEVE